MTVKTKRISTLIESQLPEFISNEYELFGKFVQKYYESQEVQGGPLDIISNIQKYADIDYYEKNLLKQNDTLAVSINSTDTTVVLTDASSFPEKEGYVRIDDEIIFYKDRTDTELLNCVRGVSGNTTLGDLYDSSNFVSTNSSSHNYGKKVYNISNLFLYAFVKSFESQYLGGFPEKYLKGEVDKRTLIKNINKFYKTKGTTSSIEFIFNTIIAKDYENIPSVYNPRDFTYKSSESNWVNVYALKVKVISGDPRLLIGNKIIQNSTDEYDYASATVDNVYPEGTLDGEKIWNIVLAPETVNGTFAISTKTRLEKTLPDTHDVGDRVDVFSTVGWEPTGSILIGEEVIEFDDKNVTQFIIKKRGTSPVDYQSGETVYKPVIISGSSSTLLTLGVVYNLPTQNPNPYSYNGDEIQISSPGFETSDPKIVKVGTNIPRWILNTGLSVSSSTNQNVENSLNGISTNVSAIFSDDQYYYVASSSFPSYNIFDGTTVTEEIKDQKLLRIIRKESIATTEKYKTPKRDVGILLNGVPLYSYKDQESIRYGKLERIDVNTQGRNYARPPFVLIDGLPNKARAIMSGQVVDSIVVDTNEIFVETPKIEIVSGRNAKVRSIVTGGKITSLVIDDPGEFYSSSPIIRIRDLSGKGRFAEYNAIVDTDGHIIDFEKINEGSFYSQDNVVVEVFSVGEGATGIPSLKEWNKNRFKALESNLDTEYGFYFKNYNKVLEYGYGQIANPKSLRVELGDNLNLANTEPTVKTHSPIIGFAYDGNPIYGPFGYENPLDKTSSIVRMTSSYSLKGDRNDGPSTVTYPIGSFVDDYVYTHKSGSLDQNNGRFCVTPDYPNGTYAYFITIDSDQTPKFPYIIGENFYSLPVDSNYNSNINQNDIPKDAKRLSSANMPKNGEGLIAKISEVKSGGIDRVYVERSSSNFSVNSEIYFNNSGTEGDGAKSIVSSVKGKSVNYLQSKENKVVKLTTIQNAYLFTDDILRQPASGASGQIVGTVQNDNVIVLKNVIGTFNNSGTFSADTKTFVMVLDQDSSYTKGAILSLTDGINPPIATGEVLEGTSRQNTVQIKVLSGVWVVDDNYFLQSSNLFNTSGTKITVLTSLSDNLEPFEVNQKVALIETSDNHGLGVGDEVIIDINPDDSLKTKTYYLRKRLYQKVKFRSFNRSTNIDYSGVGVVTILNGGRFYTPGVYTNIPLVGGSGVGATATITVEDTGSISRVGVTIQDGGIGYSRGDYLTVEDDQLGRSGGTLSYDRLTIYVDHAGVAYNSSKIKVKSANGFSVGDFINVGSEIVEISSIDDNVFTVIRGKENTESVNHYDNQEITLYKPRYNFVSNFQLENSPESGYIKSYDPETQEAFIVYNYGVEKSQARKLTISTTFFDSSVPQRLVSVDSVGEVENKFEFSEDNIDFVPNPIINIQEFYRYKFDTSHSSLTDTYFDLSPSTSYNLLTLEKVSSNILPGNSGSFTDVKFGFGSRLSDNDYKTKVGTNFTNFYYFDNKNIVNSENSYLKIVQDPLQGTKTVNYVTPNRFVYDIPEEPLWDGSGDISYTTSGQFSVGEVNTIDIINSGKNYKKVPIITGCYPTKDYRGKATVLFDENTKVITEVRIDELGSNYVNPVVVITDGDGTDAVFKATAKDGKLFSVTVENPGKNYTYAPTIDIIEGDVEFYAEGDNIGIPQTVSIIRNGGAFHLDKTVSSKFTSKYTVSLKTSSLVTSIGPFFKGEKVTQIIDNTVVFSGIVSEWRNGSNLLKIEDTVGIIREDIEIIGLTSRGSGLVKSIFVSDFDANITSFYDNLGFYTSDKGKLGVANQKLTDSFFYQDYSYVVKSKTSIEQWRDLIKSTTHPAGFKLFGQVDVETSSAAKMPLGEETKASHFTSIQLWDPNKNRITVENTRRVLTQTVQKVENTRIKSGRGSATTSEFNFNETRAFEFTLSAPFDGYYDSDGRLQGTTMFQVLDAQGNPFTPISEESLIITLDGILQEPKVAYTVSQDKIIFSNPPLGPGVKLTGNDLSSLTPYSGTTFYGRSFYFKNNQYNDRYIRKIRNIFQRSGRWLDAANQIDRNKQFIVEESIGYGKENYPNLDWSTKLDDYSNDIRYILDAYDHDLRFGGNSKVVSYAEIFARDADYIKNNKIESLDIFNYATKLAKLAIRNWDYIDNNVSYIQGSREVQVTNSKNLAIGMSISSGRAFPSGTVITEINSETSITVSNPSIVNSGVGPGGAPDGLSTLSGSTSGDYLIPTSTGVVPLGETFEVSPGDELIAPLSFSGIDKATFFFSGINNGTFYDASNLILKNKLYLQEEVSEYIYANYSLPPTDKEKCYRDLGYLIDAIVYHLRFGGNSEVVKFAKLYYVVKKYPEGEELTYINRSQEETNAAIDAWNTLASLMILAMRNSLGNGTYTSIEPFIDLNVSLDSQLPLCVEVESAINSMIDIVKDIIANGTGVVEIVDINENKEGNWSATKTYSNYNIIDDPLLTENECDNVVSSLDSLYENLNDVLYLNSVDVSTPDYIDGETKEFDLYWENGDVAVLEEDENLLITVNAVLQETKFNSVYPGDDSYYIDRTVVPNKLVFDVAPIWDQDAGAKTLGEPTAVEKVSGVGIGNYKRLTIDPYLINNVRSGPFIILDLEDLTVQNIEQSDCLLVFIDGVLQRENISYTVSGPNIYFNFPITEQMKIDMRYFYGRDVGQVLNLYDYNPNEYYAKAEVVLEVTSGIEVFVEKKWLGIYKGSKFHAAQINNDGTYNIIGEVINYRIDGSKVIFDCFGYKAELIEGLDVYFMVKENYEVKHGFEIDYSNSSITYLTDTEGRLVLNGNDQNWRGTYYRKTYRNPFINLSNNSKIKVDGEDEFRKIRELPSFLTSKEQRVQEQVSNSYFAQVDVSSYNGITRGEGLSIVAIMEKDGNGNITGRIERLEWNQRSYDPITQPTAYQYYTPPVVNFIPENGNGGGARANVLVSKGQVISVDLIDGGSGYTEAPRVIVARHYEVLEETDIGVSQLKVGINQTLTFTLSSSSTVDILGNQISGVNSFTSILFDSPVDSNRVITSIVTPEPEEASKDFTASVNQLVTVSENGKENVPEIGAFTQTNEYVSIVAGRVEDIVSTTIVKANRQLTSTINNVIQNVALGNVNYYEVGAFLDIDLDVTDNIVYISDTSKFKTNGYLLIGNEVVRYMRKLSDRFLTVQRGENNTIAQFWPAGTFLRQIPDPISIASAGIIKVESESEIVTVKGGSEIGGTERKLQKQIFEPIESVKTVSTVVSLVVKHTVVSQSDITIKVDSFGIRPAETIVAIDSINYKEISINAQIQTVHSQFTMRKEHLELLSIPPPSGIVDGYQESVFIDDPISTRLNGFVNLDNDYGVIKRDGSIIFITNSVFGFNLEYIGNYTPSNAGHVINHFNGIFDDGTANVSGLSLLEMSTYFPSLTINDFVERKNSSYTLSGDKFNLMPPSIQNPVTTSLSSGNITDNISVENTIYFPNSGLLFSSNGSVIEYTSKTSTSFEGCSLVRGPNSISLGDELIPFSIL